MNMEHMVGPYFVQEIDYSTISSLALSLSLSLSICACVREQLE